MKKTARFLIASFIVIFLLSSILIFLDFPVRAAVSSCTATVSPNTVTTNVDTYFTFTIENTDSVDVKWIKITRPSDKFFVNGGGVSGWNLALNDPTDITLTSGTLTSGNTQVVSGIIGTRVGEAASANWTVEVSDDSGGASAFSCTGTLGTAISGSGTDTFEPTISDIAVTDVSDTSVKVTWTTDEDADSTVEYGATSSYGSTESSPTLTTSHSISITGLSANSTDHYRVKSTDAAGNEAESDDYTFATSKEPTTTTVTESAPSITNISASVSFTQATITWTTDRTADSQVEYGLTNTYGQSSSLATSRVTSHSVTISDLKTNTTYHYQVKSKIASGNLAISADKTFTTKKAPPPVISLVEKDKKITSIKTPKIAGSVNSTLASQVEVSLNGGTTWVAVGKQASGSRDFSYTPAGLEDDNYTVIARAIDIADQEGKSKSFVLVVDTLPPHVGGTSYFLGHQKLFPNETGTLVVPEGSKLSVVMSVIGGPTMVQVKTSESTQSLTRMTGTNLWKGEVTFENEGDFDIEVVSKDGADNEVTQSIGKVSILAKGSVVDEDGNPVEGAEVRIFVQIENPASFAKDEWQLWEAQVFNQENPQTTDQSGTYHYLVPQGTYKLVVKKQGFREFVSKPFTLDNVAAINPRIALETTPGITISDKQFYLPWFLDIFAKEGEVALETTLDGQMEDLGVGKKAADFSLPATLGGEMGLSNFAGRKVLITFWTTWDPTSTEQIAILDKIEEPENVVLLPIALQESKVHVNSYLAKGGYLINSLVDKNGEILDNYQILALPQHVLIGENGIIKEVKIGVLSEIDLIDLISN